MTTATPVAAPMSMQGIAIPAAVVDSREFRRLTRRQTQQEKTIPFTLGANSEDTVPLRRSDILAEVQLHITGNLTITPGAGAVASTAMWPYGLLKNVKFAANGSSQLINARGWTLKAREFAKDEGLSDRGVTQTIGGTPRSQGTLSLASESWGVGQSTSALSAQTNTPIDLVVTIPVAEDMYDLTGAVFLQSSSAELSVVLDWANPSDLFTMTGGGLATLSGNIQVLSTKFKIPTVNGAIIVPDLSMFHSFVETNNIAVGSGESSTTVLGQGAGKLALRTLFQLANGTPNAPVPLTAANFGLLAWRYGTSETPDQYIDGSHLRVTNEREYSADLGGLQGYGCFEWAKGGFRDVVDLGTTVDLRLVTTINNGVALSNQRLWYAVETLYASGQA